MKCLRSRVARTKRGTSPAAVLATLFALVPVSVLASDNDISEFECLIEPYLSVNVGAAVNGVIEKIYVDRSSVVSKGDKLVQLQSSLEQVAVGLASARAEREAEIQASETSLAFNNRKHARLRKLHRQKLVPEHQMDEAATEMHLASLQLRQAEKDREIARMELLQAREALKLRSIESPIDGVVIERFKVPGEFVEDAPILKIAQLDPLRVEVVAPVSVFGRITSGMQAEVFPEVDLGRRLIATVTLVDRVVDAASGTFGIRLELPNADYTVPGGLRCRVRFLPGTASDPVHLSKATQ